jgi:hypothetical protein
VPEDLNTSRQGSEVQTSTLSTLPGETTIASDIGKELLQVLKNNTAYNSTRKFGEEYALLQEILTDKHSELSITH